jgi:TatD DNase family protein
MLIDTHAHIYVDRFSHDFEAMLGRAREAGVEEIVMPAIDIPSIERALELAGRFDGLFVMAGLHPSEVKDASDADFERVVELAKEEKVVAIGESGLDYYWDRSFDEKQHDFLRRHIQLAVDVDLPIILHNREATTDILAILSDERRSLTEPSRLRGILHCFTDDAARAREAHDLGFLIGIGGVLTFKNSGLAESLSDVPLEWMVLETDAPYLAPAPHRGKRNEPAYVRLVADCLASSRGTSLEEVARVTSQTARNLFGLPPLNRKTPADDSTGAIYVKWTRRKGLRPSALRPRRRPRSRHP